MSNKKPSAPQDNPEGSDEQVEFVEPIENSVANRTGIHALSAFLMERHEECKMSHLQCGHVHRMNGDHERQMIAEIACNVGPDGRYRIAVYLTQCEIYPPTSGHEALTAAEACARFAPLTPYAYRKLVVQPTEHGNYNIVWGPIGPPLTGEPIDLSTGQLIPEEAQERHFYGNPSWGHYQYWDEPYTDYPTEGLRRFFLLQIHGEWWIFMALPELNGLIQVGAITVADSPMHNRGIHTVQPGSYIFARDQEMRTICERHGFVEVSVGIFQRPFQTSG